MCGNQKGKSIRNPKGINNEHPNSKNARNYRPIFYIQKQKHFSPGIYVGSPKPSLSGSSKSSSWKSSWTGSTRSLTHDMLSLKKGISQRSKYFQCRKIYTSPQIIQCSKKGKIFQKIIRKSPRSDIDTDTPATEAPAKKNQVRKDNSDYSPSSSS